jgi:hypothetical protein
MTPLGHLEVDVESGHRRVAVVHLPPPLAGGRRLRERERRRRLARRNVLEGLRHAPESVRRVDVPHDRQERVGRRVVATIEIARVAERGRLEVVHGPDDRMLVGKGVVCQRVGRLERGGVRLVVHPQALLLLHGLALVVELLLREDERAHPVGLEEEREVERLGGHGLEIVRPVLGRRPVHRAARLGDEAEMLSLADVLRALEHEVLEEVREPGLAGRLDAASDVVRHVDRHEGDAALRRHDDREAVREALDVKRNFEVEGRSDGVLLGKPLPDGLVI